MMQHGEVMKPKQLYYCSVLEIGRTTSYMIGHGIWILYCTRSGSSARGSRHGLSDKGLNYTLGKSVNLRGVCEVLQASGTVVT